MDVEVSIVVDAPRDDVFAILTDYGEPVRRRINPALTSQRVVERDGDVVICENEWERNGKTVRLTRRYTVTPPDTIVEEPLDKRAGMTRIVTRVEAEGDQTRLTMTTTYQLPGLWRFLGQFAAQKIREADDELLVTLKTGIENEFEEVAED